MYAKRVQSFVFLGLFAAAFLNPNESGIFAFSDAFENSDVVRASAEGEARENSQTMALLDAANNINVNASIGGGDIMIVDDRALLSAGGASEEIGERIENRENSNRQSEISIYVVREGDTVSQIASLFGVSTNTVRWANDLSRNEAIQTGQTLVILPVTGVQYTVESGDTIESIARAFDGEEEEILQYNEIASSDELQVGEDIVIPHGEIAPEASAGTPSQVTTNAGPVENAVAPTPSTSGYFMKPVSNYVRTQGLHGYNAVDLAANAGTSIYAAASGEVIVSKASGWNGGYGKYMVIKHPNGTQTLYAHLSSVLVHGGRVVQGQVIGYMGNSGRSTGTHLHFEVRGAQNPF